MFGCTKAHASKKETLYKNLSRFACLFVKHQKARTQEPTFSRNHATARKTDITHRLLKVSLVGMQNSAAPPAWNPHLCQGEEKANELLFGGSR